MRGLSSAVFVAAVLAVASEDHHQKELKDHYHHLAYIAEFDCHWPQPRVISVHELFPEKDIKHKAFFPDVTVLHRCDSAAGCCPSNHVCRPKHSHPLHLPFKVTFLEHMHEHKKGSWIIDYHIFDNHTECECVEHHYEHKKDSHHEPDHHLEYAHKDHHEDSYHQSDNPHKDHHDDSYHHSDYPQKDHQDDSYYKPNQHSENSYKTDRRSTRTPDYTQREPNSRPNYSSISSSATPEDISTPPSSSPDYNEQQESSTATTTTTGKIDERDFSSYFD